jgi:4-diphosphocytidyl-2-C-methyl-D-erythritol kinase
LSLALPARAKLNLDLQVVRRRADGFHDLETTMQTIDLHDVLVVERARTTELTLSGLSVAHNDNSVLKAHDALERASGKKLPASFHLHKRIPAGSGMGGASSDAAAALKALKAVYARELGDVDLGPVAEEVGSDVPFFLTGGRAHVEGRGERVTPQPTTPLWFAIAWPGIELSTQRVYAKWDEVGGQDLREAAMRLEPRLRAFAQQLGDGWRMTGSGSAFFRTSPTRHQAEEALALADVAQLDCWTTVATAVA